MNLPFANLDQCLFGYDDGHRLLASSMPLGAEEAALVELSDLAPGVTFGATDAYWTGVPVPGVGRYALMRTWLAPEMPRPGCVWTHAILIDPESLGELEDLAALTALFRRPTGRYERDFFRGAVKADSGVLSKLACGAPIDRDLVEQILLSLYGNKNSRVAVHSPGDADGAIFAVWSQQWPRLRRNFRFQTAVARGDRPTPTIRLDITLRLANADRAPMSSEIESDWLAAAVSDVSFGGHPGFREFLSRYGGDVRRPRGSFKPLVQIKLLDESHSPSSADELIALVKEEFPSRDDAVSLKQDVVDGLLIPSAQVEALSEVVTRGEDALFPLPTDVGIARLAQQWPVQPVQLLHLAEVSAESEDALCNSIFETITSALPPEEFWGLVGGYRRVLERMVRARPILMVSDKLLELDDQDIANLLNFVPNDANYIDALLLVLLRRDSRVIAQMMIERFPAAVARQVINSLNLTDIVPIAWMQCIRTKPEAFLNPIAMQSISRTSILYRLAESLGWLTDDVVKAGPQPWLAAVHQIATDLDDERRDILRAFFISVAIAAGGEGGRRLIESFFGHVHEQILKSRLPWRAKDILSPLLPELGWSRLWDFALRLRLGIALTYIRNSYSGESFASLSSSRKTLALLSEAASELQGGKYLVKAVEKKL